MKIGLLLLTAFIAIQVNSQITVTSADFANSGDTVRMSQATDPLLDYASTGAAYTWDFSTLTPNAQIVKDFHAMSQAGSLVQLLFGVVAPTKYKATYFTESTAIPVAQLTQFLGVPIENIFSFTRLTTDSLTAIGYSMSVSGFEIPFRSDTIEKKYDFPIQYGNTTYSRGYTNVDMSQVIDAQWRQYRTHASEVDGYGTIITPYGSFNALRIRHDISEVDSLYYTFPIIGAMWIPLPIPDSHEYEWWTNGEKEPILRVITNIVGGTEFITSIEYRDIYRGLDAGVEELAAEITMYPNPVSEVLSINSDVLITGYRILDSKGAVVIDVQGISLQAATIEVASLEKGAYLIQLSTERGSSIKSFIKE